ncbi:hypothetical protein H8E07_08720 [bacterium]|nr:hypothetical protein [bacterium]
MKKVLTNLSLLLILVAVSTGPGIAWGAQTSQEVMLADDPITEIAPQVDDPGDDVECFGDPDDAITGNRNNGFMGGFSDLGGLDGLPDSDHPDYELWLALLMMLQCQGLI